ncbi:lanthionine synthetase C family protein [Bailinhaonella thermotolerans]|uniref:Lanthionine synthetase n=1 Tax=Bailinhaonella thermotolerans TaxID=1070861 RepID=A0A3A4APL4_9ACTN|nr:lanthionine synthetase C family protein [Bailinhaonella thermotolerans]RJL23218.1 hypothetical protein D5H75_33135 [Bailinhaonella thermotolerans]
MTAPAYAFAGAAGDALLAIEQARRGLAGWDDAHQRITAATRDGLPGDPCGLFRGPPAIAYLLRLAARPGYAAALARLDAHITQITQARLAQAHARLAAGRAPTLREYDLISGLTGLGAYLRVHGGQPALLAQILDYLVRLTRPLPGTAGARPGWWTRNGPADRPDPAYPDGHANLGMAHGIAGPLALLSLTVTDQGPVPGQRAAIQRICAWLDKQQHGPAERPWWPGIVTPGPRPGPAGPQRPSWCYGTPGIARALQLAGTALADQVRQARAEHALAACLADAGQRAQLADASLCHGWAGTVLTAWRAATNARTPALARHLPRLHARLHRGAVPAGEGLLEGAAGVRLAALTVITGDPVPAPPWDACLLLT